MKYSGCDFCNEIINIEPAKFVACDNTDKEQVEFEDFYSVLNELDKDRKISKRNVGFNN